MRARARPIGLGVRLGADSFAPLGLSFRVSTPGFTPSGYILAGRSRLLKFCQNNRCLLAIHKVVIHGARSNIQRLSMACPAPQASIFRIDQDNFVVVQRTSNFLAVGHLNSLRFGIGVLLRISEESLCSPPSTRLGSCSTNLLDSLASGPRRGLNRLFDMSTRSSSTSARFQKGTGLFSTSGTWKLSIDLLRERVLGRTRFHSEFDNLFAFGIDPVDGGLPTHQPSIGRLLDSGCVRCKSGPAAPS